MLDKQGMDRSCVVASETAAGVTDALKLQVRWIPNYNIKSASVYNFVKLNKPVERLVTGLPPLEILSLARRPHPVLFGQQGVELAPQLA